MCGGLIAGCISTTSSHLAEAQRGDPRAQFLEGFICTVGTQEAKTFSESDTTAELRRVRNYQNASMYIKIPGQRGEVETGIDRPYVFMNNSCYAETLQASGKPSYLVSS